METFSQLVFQGALYEQGHTRFRTRIGGVDSICCGDDRRRINPFNAGVRAWSRLAILSQKPCVSGRVPPRAISPNGIVYEEERCRSGPWV